ncbi:MAG: alpha-2-macroglobulin family protein, partial [Alloprevotella sp.]
VCVSGVLFSRTEDQFRVEGSRPISLRLLDANRKAVDSLSVRSDSLGAFAGTFLLPAETLPGVITVEARCADISQTLRLRVEDYKRPIFTVTTRPVAETYQPGDTVSIRGEARTFTGVPLLEARVQYEIRRIGWWRGNATTDVQRGETRTDEQGGFVIPVATKKGETSLRNPYSERETWSIHYTVTAESGETVQGSCSLPVNPNAERLDFQIPSQLCRSELRPLTVSCRNASGTGRATAATYVIQPEGSENKIIEERFTTGEAFSTEGWQRLLSDRYWFIVRTDDGLLCDTATFCIFGENDVSPADRRRPLFFHKKDITDGKEVWVGSPERDACLFFDFLVGDEVKEHRLIALNDSLLHFRFPWKEEYGEGAKAIFALLRNDTLHTQTVEIPRPAPDKQLHLRWSTFRSRLTPGSQEEWVLRLENANGTVPGAAVMARMTDASLEQLARAPWELNHLHFGRRLPFGNWTDQPWLYAGARTIYAEKHSRDFIEPFLNFTKWDSSLFAYYRARSRYPFRSFDGAVLRSVAVSNSVAGAKLETAAYASAYREVPDRMEEDAVADVSAKVAAPANAKVAASAIALRTDFAETAFFLPALRTNEKGEALVCFTLPESVTSWNVSALAFTSAMDYGKLDTTVVARKEFMVEPSLPRFIRKGDRCSVSVRVTNLSERSLQPGVTFLLTDAATGNRLGESRQDVTVEAGRTAVLQFSLPADLTADVVCCRVMGEAKNFSDGEEHLLPVLTNEVRVERSLPLTLDKEGVTTLRIDTLLTAPGARHRSLTVELTTHPVWAAVAALPSLTETEQSQSAVEWATRYYALALGLETLQRCPAIEEMVTVKNEEVEVWAKLRTEGFSDLTPWLTEAERAAAQTRGLKNLFNAPLTDARLATSLAKLSDLQRPDGGFGWFPGMKSSPHITSEIVLLLSRVKALTAQNKGDELLRRGMAYLHKLLVTSQRNDGRRVYPFISEEVALRYLYARALMGVRYDNYERKYVEKLANRASSFPMLEKAWMVSVLQNAGKKNDAAELGKSLLEYTVSSAEMGRYFDTSRAEATAASYRIPTQCAAIGALQRLGYEKETEEMRRWLLQAKRTQMWVTSAATADAIFALLAAPTNGETPSANSAYHIYIPESVGTPLLFTLSHGKKILAVNAPSQTDTPSSMGHFEQTFTEDVACEASELRLDKRTPGVSYAAVTVSAVVPDAQVKNSGKELSISRRVEVKRDGQWLPLGGTEVRVGDRLRVVYVLKAARDFDFVSLESARPACLQPVRSLSGHVWEGELDTYRAVRDASTRYFISSLPKGEHVFTEELFADRCGTYSSGIATLSGVFSPEFSATAASFELTVKEAK